MPRSTARQKKANEIIDALVRHYRAKKIRSARRERRRLQSARVTVAAAASPSVASESSSSSKSSSEHDTSSLSSMDTSSNSRSGWETMSSDDSSSSEDETDSDGSEADIEDFDAEFDDGPVLGGSSRLLRRARHAVEDMYLHRYQVPRKRFPRAPATLPHILNLWHDQRPNHFRKHLRVTPYTFDCLLERIEDDPIFTNNASSSQMPVAHQLGITLYRFGHLGNAASLDSVSTWAVYAKGTILLATRRVLTAILRQDFLKEAIHLPTPAEKEKAKQWVEDHSCAAWRDGWCMVDGTLIPLFSRPYWFGESYYDRKGNYSLNIQVVNLPNLRIIDYGFGYTGSTNDSTAWAKTRTYMEHEDILEGNEFIWGDSAYPTQTWVVTPYTKPDSDIPENAVFNNHVSMVRIRSEHAIGFLKGRFQSLRGLRVTITDEATHKLATFWVIACMAIHTFAITCEEEEQSSSGLSDNSFIQQGLSTSDSSDRNDEREAPAALPTGPGPCSVSFAAGRARREELKRKLFQAQEDRSYRRARRQQGFNSESSESENDI